MYYNSALNLCGEKLKRTMTIREKVYIYISF